MRYPGILRASGPAALLSGALLCTLGACAPTRSSPRPFRGLEESEQYAAAQSGRRIGPVTAPAPLSIDREAVGWEVLLPRLAEAAGGLVVEETTLDRLLEQELARRGMAITDADISRERDWLALSITGGVGVPASELDDLTYELRQRRGLGPVRFGALLKRNAMLRALVQDRVTVRSDQLELAWRVRHGERLRIRIIVTPTEREAQSLAARAGAGP
ncbi:MAG: hypothetical protein K8E66_06970, partial [Phycisphaerales bacterium]|nr:hypothetical protein [Phycisphaerales bacterium]